jgi:hypothetical protein
MFSKRFRPTSLTIFVAGVFYRTMRRPSTRRQTGKRALIAGAVALFFSLQGLFAPFVAMNAHAANGASLGPSIGVAAESALCQTDDAGAPADRAGHDHQGCCILCEASARDAAFALVVAFTAAALAPRQDAVAPGADYPEPQDARPKAAGWASSWSSRAPPFFS